jgi:predicted  nucleic acid-binding Zn-ribbon protein
VKSVVGSTKHLSEVRVDQSVVFYVVCCRFFKHLSEVRVDKSVVFCEVCCRFYKAPE